jgi:hypothetical protein
MKRLFIFVLIFALQFQAMEAQTFKASGNVSLEGSFVAQSVPLSFFATLPVAWVNSGSTTGTGVCSAPGGVYDKTITLGTLTVAGLQTAVNSWGTDADEWELLKIPHGTLLNSSTYDGDNALVSMPVKAGATKCLVIDSDTPLPAGTIVCSHGLPLPGQGTRNPGCTNDIASMWTIRMDGSSAGQAGYAAIYEGIGVNHILIRSMEGTIQPNTSQSQAGVAGRRIVRFDGDQTGRPFAIGIEASYIHGWDPGDAGQPSGACAAWTMTGTVTVTNGSPVLTYASGNSFGPTFPGGTINITVPGTGVVNYTVSGSFNPSVSDTTANLTGNFTQASGTYSYTLSNPPSQYLNGCGDDLQAGIVFNCDNCWMEWNYVEKIHAWGAESHSVSFGFSNGPNKIAHNWIEAGSCGLFSGGSPVDTNGGPVADVELRGNYLGRDLNYRFLTGSSGNSPGPNFGCGPLTSTNHKNCPFTWAVKNVFELKLSVRIVIVGNIFDSNWADGQGGNLILTNVRTCSGGQVCGIFDPVTHLPRTTVTNMYFQYNWFRNAPEGPQIATRSGSPGNGGGLSNPIENFDYINNLFTNVGDANQFNTPGSNLIEWGSGSNPLACVMSRTSNVAHAACAVGTVSTSNTHIGAPSSVSRLGNVTTIAFAGQRLDPQVGGTVVVAGSSDTSYNTTGTAITGVLQSGTSTLCTTNNNTAPQPCINSNGTFGDTLTYANTGTGGTLCSSTTTCAAAGIVVTFPSLGYSITDISVGDDVHVPTCISGTAPTCGGVTANHDCLTTGGSADDSYATGETSASLALNPTSPTGLDVYYANSGSNDNTGTICSALDNGSGFPKNASFRGNTVISVNGGGIFSANPQWQQINNNFTQNIFANTAGSAGAANNVNIGCNLQGEGSVAMNACWDTSLLVEGNNVLLGRLLTNWASYGGAGLNSVPANGGCPGATATSLCIGFSGFMNGVTFPTTACAQSGAPFNCPLQSLPWANNLTLANTGLVASSSWPTYGINPTTMQTAMLATQYICPAACGTGPYPD